MLIPGKDAEQPEIPPHPRLEMVEKKDERNDGKQHSHHDDDRAGVVGGVGISSASAGIALSAQSRRT